MTAENLQVLWQTIQAEEGNNPGWYQRRLPLSGPGNVYTALQNPSGLRRISMNVPVAILCDLKFPDDVKGFRVQQDAVLPGVPSVQIHIVEANNMLKEVFPSFCADLLSQYSRYDTVALSAKSLWRRMLSWKRFFQTTRGSEITREEYIGILGELLVVKDLLVADSNHSRVIAGWKGPYGQAQDFQYSNRAIEVKTSLAVEMTKVAISNIRQLDDAGLESLYLCCQSGDLRDNTGLTMSAIIAEIIALISSDDEAVSFLEESLLAAGMRLPDSTPWAQKGFVLLKREFYKVIEGFPRLLPSAVPDGVVDINYAIDLHGCHNYLVENEFVRNQVREVISHG